MGRQTPPAANRADAPLKDFSIGMQMCPSFSIERAPLRSSFLRFLHKSWPEKLSSIRFRFKYLWNLAFPSIALPVRLPYGGWWMARNDVCSDAIFAGNFEERERRFTERFLREKMTVLDIGAHHGFYTMLAAKKVGKEGRVIAFEPSPRECARLATHLRLNRCTNVQVESCALGSSPGEAQLYVVEGVETGCNSLRLPNVAEPTRRLRVDVATLDQRLEQHRVKSVDFIKLDAEGAELDVLKGGARLFERRPRPVLLCEVAEIRTAPWGYPAREIVMFLRHRGYRWYRPLLDGSLEPVPPEQERFHGNLVAVPEERADLLPSLARAEGRDPVC